MTLLFSPEHVTSERSRVTSQRSRVTGERSRVTSQCSLPTDLALLFIRADQQGSHVAVLCGDGIPRLSHRLDLSPHAHLQNRETGTRVDEGFVSCDTCCSALPAHYGLSSPLPVCVRHTSMHAQPWATEPPLGP